MLRHMFAFHCLRDGGGIEVLSKLLGHSTVKTTERYATVYETSVRAEFERVGREKLDKVGQSGSGDLLRSSAA